MGVLDNLIDLNLITAKTDGVGEGEWGTHILMLANERERVDVWIIRVILLEVEGWFRGRFEYKVVACVGCKL